MATKAAPHELEPLLSYREAARVLGLSLNGLKRLAYRGELPTVHLGGRRLIDPNDLRVLIEARRSRQGASP
jgi:excisionase family DNA binding protein